MQKNVLLDKATSGTKKKLKLFKPDLLACTADELNYALTLFVKEVRKPNGEAYAADSIFYLSLGEDTMVDEAACAHSGLCKLSSTVKNMSIIIQ